LTFGPIEHAADERRNDADQNYACGSPSIALMAEDQLVVFLACTCIHRHGQPRKTAAPFYNGIRQIVSSNRSLNAAALHDSNAAFSAPGGRHIDLGVAVVRIAPAAAFEETVSSSYLPRVTRPGRLQCRSTTPRLNWHTSRAFPHGCSLEGEHRPGRTPPMNSTRAP